MIIIPHITHITYCENSDNYSGVIHNHLVAVAKIGGCGKFVIGLDSKIGTQIQVESNNRVLLVLSLFLKCLFLLSSRSSLD